MADALGTRAPVVYYTEAYSSPATEALATITGVTRGSTVTTTQLTVASGKTLRVSFIGITGALLGTTVTASTIRLRANLTGAATASSPIYYTGRMGNPSIGTQAANYGMEPLLIPLGEGLEFPAGAGIQFTTVSTTAAMHALTLQLIGFEYTT